LEPEQELSPKKYPEPLKKKKSGAGVAKKFAGIPALLIIIL
jgi:hypothetical protein